MKTVDIAFLCTEMEIILNAPNLHITSPDVVRTRDAVVHLLNYVAEYSGYPDAIFNVITLYPNIPWLKIEPANSHAEAFLAFYEECYLQRELSHDI